MHFFNPAPLMLVEIVRAELTADGPFDGFHLRADREDADPLSDTPGFVVNRVLILNDCIRVLDEARDAGGPGHRDAQRRRPMGPCTLVDLVGIDVHVHASEALYEKTREPRMAPPPRLVAMRNAGLLGRKSGRGFLVRRLIVAAPDRTPRRSATAGTNVPWTSTEKRTTTKTIS